MLRVRSPSPAPNNNPIIPPRPTLQTVPISQQGIEREAPARPKRERKQTGRLLRSRIGVERALQEQCESDRIPASRSINQFEYTKSVQYPSPSRIAVTGIECEQAARPKREGTRNRTFRVASEGSLRRRKQDVFDVGGDPRLPLQIITR